jgi:hypothetical protein
MFINTRITLAAALVLGAASAALANDIDVNLSSTQSTREWQYLGHKEKHEIAFVSNDCPALEGYPDCHPDGNASWGQYSTTGEFTAQRKSSPPKTKRQITPRSFGANAYRSLPAPTWEPEWPRMNCDMPIWC